MPDLELVVGDEGWLGQMVVAVVESIISVTSE